MLYRSVLFTLRMINIAWLEIALLLSLVNIKSSETASCPQSRSTLTSVPSCPKSKEEWERRAESKRCLLVRQQCESLEESVYHCIINNFANETFEVCAPKVLIIGQSCVEYNVRGATIQGSPYVKCTESCPFSYLSTDVYKYQDCFKTVARRKWTDNMNIEGMDSNFNISSNPLSRAWQIVALLSIAININVILFIVTPWFIVRKGKRKYKRRKELTNDLQENLEPAPLISLEVDFKPAHMIDLQGDFKSGMYIAAIDIGDIYLTMAISTPHFPEDIKPLGSIDRMCLLSDPKDEKTIFGEEALNEYILDRKNHKEHRKFKTFKLSDDGMDDEDYRKALTYIKDKAKHALWKEWHCVDQIHVRYVFIIPNYWKEGAIEKFKWELSKLNKCEENRFCVIKREQTLSPFIRELKARVVCLNFNVDNLVLRPEPKSNTYAILHVGSTHYDLILSEVEKDQREEKIPPEEPKEWKSPPNDRFLNLFKNIFGGDTVKQWEEKFYWEYLSFFLHFEELVKETDEHTADTTTFDLELPKKLIELGKKKKIEEEMRAVKGIRFEKNKWTFQIELKLLRTFFDGVRDEVHALLDNSWQSFHSKNVKCVVMTGAYSKRKIIWEIAENNWFKYKNFTIVVPENTHEFAMGGAYYGQKKDW